MKWSISARSNDITISFMRLEFVLEEEISKVSSEFAMTNALDSSAHVCVIPF